MHKIDEATDDSVVTFSRNSLRRRESKNCNYVSNVAKR